MKRFVLVLALSGCMESQPSPAMVRLQGACEAGDMRACEAVVAQEEARRAAFAEYWANRPPVQVYQPVPVTPLQAPQRTNCTAVGNTLNCTTY